MTDEGRIDLARETLLRFKSGESQNDHWVPAWSSTALESSIAALMTSSDGGVDDVFHGLWDALRETVAPLTDPMAHFIKDIVVHCFTRYRASYNATNLTWMSDAVLAGCTEAQAYFAMYALPEDAMRASKETILARFRGTTRQDEAEGQLG